MGGKAEKGTPKYIANKIKAKGLQKLRWYCQMCQKQCRDENGFKCHTMSESHQRQLLLFADNASKYIDQFSKEFSDGYVDLLSRQFGTKRVNANKVYQEYISNRDHLHMNATQWETLTDFVKWLGREGKCVVDETEKGWFVTYIDRDPAAIAAQEAKAKKEKMDKDDQERMLEFIQKQVEKGKKENDSNIEPTYTELKRESSQERLTFNLNLKRKNEDKKSEVLSSSALKSLKSKEDSKRIRIEESTSRQSALDEIMKMEEKAKEKANSAREGKLEINPVPTRLASVNHLETVVPSCGRKVRVVNGAYRGCVGTLRDVRTDAYSCDIEIAEGPLTGRLVKGVEYEDISKMAS
ncbi:DNA/RNA-binding protein KIN17 [Bombyx mandarina]|uniref:DNA/RNA-binding protein KIN17 n=1 Tax=Bombyx mandarina TaxID=7092 RepID=A0A6J2JXT0_BOMMA|nr:DNA/RNA-binding protein KIN17 [Bombyx mandarina]